MQVTWTLAHWTASADIGLMHWQAAVAGAQGYSTDDEESGLGRYFPPAPVLEAGASSSREGSFS